jgi:hypothetical protein
LTDELKAKIAPVRSAVRDNLKAREDRVKIRKRTHKAQRAIKPSDESASAAGSAAGSGTATPMEVDTLEDESTIRKREAEKVQELVKVAAGDAGVQPGTNWSGLYELSGEFSLPQEMLVRG